MSYHSVCYLQMILFLLMRLERHLMISWSDRDTHWSLECFRISKLKTKYLHCCFSEREEEEGEVTIDEMIIPNVEKFKYLGSIIQ